MTTIAETKRVFLSRLDMLSHVLGIGETQFANPDAFLGKRLVDDMFPFAAQVAFACNQLRGFAQWCAGEPIDNLAPDSITTIDQAHATIAQTRAMVGAIAAADSKLDETKRIGLGPGRYCELPGHQYVADYLVPNLYFHITTAYAILRVMGAPIGKADFMRFLAPHVKHEKVG
ncbi:MAG TPA: DUF1993 domain-containing protein [Xanthomonadaceae bacterium]|nr:DUF1993 domain-containing protein [Xanthomonadaceae bacterium]